MRMIDWLIGLFFARETLKPQLHGYCLACGELIDWDTDWCPRCGTEDPFDRDYYEGAAEDDLFSAEEGGDWASGVPFDEYDYPEGGGNDDSWGDY